MGSSGAYWVAKFGLIGRVSRAIRNGTIKITLRQRRGKQSALSLHRKVSQPKTSSTRHVVWWQQWTTTKGGTSSPISRRLTNERPLSRSGRLLARPGRTGKYVGAAGR